MERVDPSSIRALRGPAGPPGPQGPRGGVAIVAATEPTPDELGSLWYSPYEAGTPPGEGARVTISNDGPFSPSAGDMWLDTST